MNYTVYWDLETSSAKTTGFTQVISCSALLTDENFNEIDRLDEVCRLNKFVTAEPMALLVNGFNPYDLKQNQSSYEMAQSIAEKFTKWIDKYKDITFIAYNNSFDVTLFRYMMYTNLLIDKLYIMNTLPSSEMDGLKLSWALGTFSDNLEVPISEETGRRSFRLEPLAIENGIEIKGRAHTAIVDCEILRDFVKKFALSDPEIFQALKKTSHKSHVLDLLHGSNEWFMHTAWYAGKEYVYPLSFCGMVENNANAAVFIDLKNVNEDIMDKSVVELKKMFSQKTKRVFRNLYINKNPILLPKSFFSKKEVEIDIKQSIIEDRHKMIQNSKELKTRIMSAAFDLNSENVFSTDYEYAETAIYGGFFDNNDKNQANSFHTESEWTDKRKIIKSFKDPRLIELAHNLIFINAPEVLTDNEKNKVGSRIANRVLDMNANPKSPYMTIPNARTEIDRLRNQFEEEGAQDKLDQLEVIDQYITEMEDELTEFSSYRK